MKRKHVGGGYMQRIDSMYDDLPDGVASSSGTRVGQRSALADTLRDLVHWNWMPAAQATRLARAAVADGQRHQDIIKLAAAAGHKMNQSGAWEGIKKIQGQPPLLSALGVARLPLKSKHTGIVHDNISILYPHRLFATLYKDHNKHFVQSMVGGEYANIGKFWAEMVDHPSYNLHPMRTHKLNPFQSHAIPISIYGDGTPATGVGKAWAAMADGIIMSSMLSPKGVTRLKNYILNILQESLMANDESNFHTTLDALWKELAWSLYWLYEGLWPDRGPDNVRYTEADGIDYIRKLTPLADGLYCVVWGTPGDLDYQCKRMLLADFNRPSRGCSLCGANNTDAVWTECVDGSCVWQGRVHSDRQFAAQNPARHRLYRHVPGVGISHYIPDEMHVKYLGTDKSFMASTLKLLTHHVLPGTPDANLKQLWNEITAEYRILGPGTTRFQTITANMIQGKSKKIPDLKGKAAQIKGLIPVLVTIWRRHMDHSIHGPAWHRDVLAGLTASARYDELLKAHRLYPRLPPLARVELRSTCFIFCQAQAALVNHFHPHIGLFNVTMKSHYLIHMGMAAGFINPYYGAVWQGEDMMRVLRRIMAASAFGRKPTSAQREAMNRYCRALSFELSRTP